MESYEAVCIVYPLLDEVSEHVTAHLLQGVNQQSRVVVQRGDDYLMNQSMNQSITQSANQLILSRVSTRNWGLVVQHGDVDQSINQSIPKSKTRIFDEIILSV